MVYIAHVCSFILLVYMYLHYVIIGSKASPTTAPKPRRHKSSASSDVFDDKESSGLFSSDQPQEGTAGSPARKKACSSYSFFTHIHTVYTHAYACIC